MSRSRFPRKMSRFSELSVLIWLYYYFRFTVRVSEGKRHNSTQHEATDQNKTQRRGLDAKRKSSRLPEEIAPLHKSK